MAINFNIYSETNSSTRTVTVDFVSDFLAAEDRGVSDSPRYFFKFSTSARTQDNKDYRIGVSEGLGDLVLKGNTSAQRISGATTAYTDIKSMIIDYIYDYVHGHAADLYGTGVTVQQPMKFTR
jgi:hypothetical protein